MCELKANDLVECIDDDPTHLNSLNMPERGRRYTVASIRPAGDGHSVRLAGLVPECRRGGPCDCGECGWDARRFRRIYRPKAANLDVFRRMLEQKVEPDPAWSPGMAPRSRRWAIDIPPRLVPLIEEALRSPAAPPGGPKPE